MTTQPRFQNLSPRELSGGNQWDTAAFLRAAAAHERANRLSPLTDALDEQAGDDPDLRRFALELAHAVILRSGIDPNAPRFRRSGPTAADYEHAAAWLDQEADEAAAAEIDRAQESAFASSPHAG